MKHVAIDPYLVISVVALAALALGVYMVAGAGWALVVASSLVLLYIILPDQGAHRP